jgi:hypothetical protein
MLEMNLMVIELVDSEWLEMALVVVELVHSEWLEMALAELPPHVEMSRSRHEERRMGSSADVAEIADGPSGSRMRNSRRHFFQISGSDPGFRSPHETRSPAQIR